MCVTERREGFTFLLPSGKILLPDENEPEPEQGERADNKVLAVEFMDAEGEQLGLASVENGVVTLES